jgi:hypothetical protein
MLKVESVKKPFNIKLQIKIQNSFQNFDHVDPPKYSDTKVDFLRLDSSGTMEKNQA